MPSRRAIALVTAALAAFGGAAAVVATGVGAGAPALPFGQALALFAVLVAGGYLFVRYRYGHETYALDLYESVVVPLVFVAPPLVVVAMVAASEVAVEVMRRNAPRKAAFNTAQGVAAAGLGSLAFALARGDGGLGGRNLAALVAAMAVVGVVNHMSLTVVLSLARRMPVRSVLREMVPLILPGWVGGWAVNLAFGLLFVSAYLHTPAATALFLVPLVLLHWGSRGYATALADRTRLAGLHSATHALAAPIDPRDAIGAFLEEVRKCFEAECVELVLLAGGAHETHRSTADRFDVVVGKHVLGDTLVYAGTAVRVEADHDGDAARALAGLGWRACASAPVRSGQRLIGALAVYDAGGLEGFEDGELAVLEALASEVAGALHKAELLATILDERRKLGEIVDNTSDGIFTLDPAGVVESWNRAAEVLTGYRTAEMLGTDHLAVLRPRDASGNDVRLDRWAHAGVELPEHVQILARAGEQRWLSCAYTRVPAGDARPPLLVVVARDVTKARELERLKEEFVATVSHELRTPLTPIKGFASTLLDGGDRVGSETRRTALEAILRSAQRLERLILNLLEVSRIESRVIDVRNAAVEVGALASRVAAELHDSWGDRTITVSEPDGPCVALGSELWVEQVLSNLLSNALKYAPGPDPVEVEIRAELGMVEVSVVDHGPGIPPQDAERVFERFERLDRSNRQAGTGLGLYIARELAKAMNGTLTLTATPGGGATFTLRLATVIERAAVAM